MNSSLSLQAQYQSPVGRLQIEADNEALTAIRFTSDEEPSGSAVIPEAADHPVLGEALRQLDEYFEGQRKVFDLSLNPVGTDFQQNVWETLRQIPFGQTCSYADLARQLGDPNKVRAIGGANGRNPIPIIIPCHRVIGANKKLIGYAGGIARKKKLLQHEGAVLL